MRTCPAVLDGDLSVAEDDARARPGIGEAQDRGAQGVAGHLGGLAGDEGLARGRGLAAVGRQVGVGGQEVEPVERHAQRVGGDLRDDGVGALADIDRALVQGDAAVRLEAEPDGRGVGSEVLPQPYHMPATPTPRRSVRSRPC